MIGRAKRSARSSDWPRSTMSDTRTIDTLHLMRALGISMIVLNHSVRFPLAGGLNIMFLISGLSFAAIVFVDNGHSIWRVSWQFVRRLLIASLALTAFWAIVWWGQVHPAELLMVSNWLGLKRVALYPVLYTQVVVQMALALALVFSIPWMRWTATHHSLAFALVSLALALGMAAFSKAHFDTIPINDKLPHLHLWNFALGWVFWAALVRREPQTRDRIALSLLLIAVAVLVFPVLELKSWVTRQYMFTLPILFFVWCPRITLPRTLAHPILLISQATLAIFFIHLPLVKAGQWALRTYFGKVPSVMGFVNFVFVMLGSILLWAAFVALARVWRQTDFKRYLVEIWHRHFGWRKGALRAG